MTQASSQASSDDGTEIDDGVELPSMPSTDSWAMSDMTADDSVNGTASSDADEHERDRPGTPTAIQLPDPDEILSPSDHLSSSIAFGSKTSHGDKGKTLEEAFDKGRSPLPPLIYSDLFDQNNLFSELEKTVGDLQDWMGVWGDGMNALLEI